jgi:predicted nucleotidyltransferase
VGIFVKLFLQENHRSVFSRVQQLTNRLLMQQMGYMHAKISHKLYKKDLLLKYQQQKQQKQSLQDRALAEARQIARALIEEYHAKTVYVFGPLSYGEFREGMSIELAVEGLPPEMFAGALAYVKQEDAFTFELTELAQVDSWTRRSIVQKGQVLT